MLCSLGSPTQRRPAAAVVIADKEFSGEFVGRLAAPAGGLEGLKRRHVGRSGCRRPHNLRAYCPASRYPPSCVKGCSRAPVARGAGAEAAPRWR